MPKKKVFVSGCFDMLHSGHVRFLEEAAGLGDVYVAVGNDRQRQPSRQDEACRRPRIQISPFQLFKIS